MGDLGIHEHKPMPLGKTFTPLNLWKEGVVFFASLDDLMLETKYLLAKFRFCLLISYLVSGMYLMVCSQKSTLCFLLKTKSEESRFLLQRQCSKNDSFRAQRKSSITAIKTSCYFQGWFLSLTISTILYNSKFFISKDKVHSNGSR